MYVFLLIFILILILLFLGSFFDAPWLPTRKKDYERIIEMAELRPGMLFYDLGSGTGDMLFYLSKRYNINCVGIEISPILYLYSKIKSIFYKNVKIMYGDFYKFDLSKADVIYAFLMSKNFDRLKKEIGKKMKKDSKIILSCWSFQNCNPKQISEGNKKIPYYLYDKTALLK